MHLVQELCGVVLGEEWRRLNLTSVPVDLIWNGEMVDRGVTFVRSRRHPGLPAIGPPLRGSRVARQLTYWPGAAAP